MDIFAIVSNFIISVISSGGYAGIALLMALDSCAIPIPSEVTMAFGGYLVHQGRFTLTGIALAGGLGSMLGSIVLYWIGYYGGRPLLERYGKYVLIHHKDIDTADRFFKKYGDASNFFFRMVPVVRTFISFPAGVAKMPVKRFMLYSFAGSFIWSWFLGWVGVKLGQNWSAIHTYFKDIQNFILAGIIILIAAYIYRHIKRK